MRQVILMTVLSVFTLTAVFAQKKNVVEIAMGSEDHTTLVAAVKAAGLAGTLQGDGPFTIFAPTNAAFEKLPDGTVAALLKPEAKSTLTDILTYHVVSGKFRAKDVAKAIKKGDGEAELEMLNGDKIVAFTKGKDVYIRDEKGNEAKVIAADLKGTNGIIHVLDTVIMPSDK